MLMSVRMAPPFPLIFLLMIHSEWLTVTLQKLSRFCILICFWIGCPFVPYEFCVSGVSSAGWGVNYSHSQICALKNSSVIMSCTYTYPTGHQVRKAFWTKGSIMDGEESPDLSEDPEYSQRLQYLGDKQQTCTIRLSHVTPKDEHVYYFRFTTDAIEGRWTGYPGVSLSVTGNFHEVKLFFCALCWRIISVWQQH